MTQLRITGGVPLTGTVEASGAKNAALPMMAAAILADGPVELLGVPRLTDVRTMGLLLRQLGVEAVQDGDRLNLVTFDAARVHARYALVRRMRAGFCVLGPLLTRRGQAVVPLPGGCEIGDRPVDLHLRGLAALGADLRLEHGNIVASARRLRGADIDLAGPRGPTVTGTANVLMAATLAQGHTTIRGAAQEPEIVDLGRMLNGWGARIEGLGTATLEIEGVERLHGGRHRILPDRIEAATLLLAIAITGGSGCVTGIVPGHLQAFLEMLAATAHVSAEADRVFVRMDDARRAIDIIAESFPGMPTDLQAQWTALLALADGPSRVEDRVFPARFGYVAELKRFGADLRCVPGGLQIAGRGRYQAAEVTAGDLRASAALILAALAAKGMSVIHAAHHLDRGYERLDDKLVQLGARIERIDPALHREAVRHDAVR